MMTYDSNSTVGTTAWKANTSKELQMNHAVIATSHKAMETGKHIDPLPNQREVYEELSNLNSFEYMKEVRVVANRLKEVGLAVNEDVKLMLRAKEAIEKQHERIRKDLAVNEQSIQIRQQRRPFRERGIRGQDGVDAILSAEKQHLVGLKRQLEIQIRAMKEHLQKLGQSRTRLNNVWKERSKVVDLIAANTSTHGLTSDVNMASYLRTSTTTGAMPDTTEAYSSANAQQMGAGGSLICKPLNADNRLQVADTHSSTDMPYQSQMLLGNEANPQIGVGNMPTGPLLAMTPECEQAMQEAFQLQKQTPVVLCNTKELIKKVKLAVEQAKRHVNAALERKMAETAALAQQLEMNVAENRVATNRVQRHYDRTALSFGRNQGPLLSRDLTVAERLDRPVMRTVQRHVGHQMPDARHLIDDQHALLNSLQMSSQNVTRLRAASNVLSANLTDKRQALHVDSDVVKMRRVKSDYRFVPGPVRAKTFML